MNKFLLFFRFGLAIRLFRECRVYGDNPEGDHHDLYTHLLLWHMRCIFQPQHMSGKERDDERNAEIMRFQRGLAHPKSLIHFVKLIDELLASAEQCKEMGLVYSDHHPFAQKGTEWVSDDGKIVFMVPDEEYPLATIISFSETESAVHLFHKAAVSIGQSLAVIIHQAFSSPMSMWR